METATIRALENMTDEGLFERVVTAVLRLDPCYEPLIHIGVNAAGKTKRSRLDGVAFVEGGRRMVAVEHTTTAATRLRGKWLFNPEFGVSDRPAGDIIKALEDIAVERRRDPALKATLVVATNRDPDQGLLADVAALVRAAKVDLDIWSRGRIAQRLDLDSDGQYIRETLLGLPARRLSGSLLEALCGENLAAFSARDDEAARVERAFDRQILDDQRPILFIVAGSGLGKTVACHKALQHHVAAGGIALILPHDVVEDSPTLDQAVLATLRRLRPSLTAEDSALAFVSEAHPLMILVEDASRSNRPEALVEKLAEWRPRSVESDQRARWRLLCPIWPHLLIGGAQRRTDGFEPICLRPGPVSAAEAAAMAMAHAALCGASVSLIQVGEIASALGFDPLLIGLNQNWEAPDPASVIADFVEGALARVALVASFTATEMRGALMKLGARMIRERLLDPSWPQILAWLGEDRTLEALKVMIGSGEVIRLEGSASTARLRFRHDRVRDWILVEAAADMLDDGQLEDELLADPLLADVVGGVLLRGNPETDLTARAATLNPMALFQALRLAPRTHSGLTPIVDAAKAWLLDPAHKTPSTLALRWEAAIALQDLERPFVRSMLALFPPDWSPVLLGRTRNGDLAGGLSLCARYGLNAARSWLPPAIEAAKTTNAVALTKGLIGFIQTADPIPLASGILRFAGIWAEPTLGPALKELWDRDTARLERLDDYLWAFSRCATETTAQNLLDPVCAAWAELPKGKEGDMPSPRNSLAAHEIRWSFEALPPRGALAYFVDRARSEDLDWPIEYMLSSIDDPITVIFAADRAAARRARSTDYYYMNFPARERFQFQHGRAFEPLSQPSRDALRIIWRDADQDEHRRVAAFDLWCCGLVKADLPILREDTDLEVLRDRALRQRLERADQTALPAFAKALADPGNFRMWFFARYVWSAALHVRLDEALARCAGGDRAGEVWECVSVLIRLSRAEAEPLLLKYWSSLGDTARFVHAGLYFGTPDLLARAAASVAASSDPKALFEHIASSWGLRIQGEPGLQRESQLQALEPYFGFLSKQELHRFSDACDENGWFDARRRLFDPRLNAQPAPFAERLAVAFNRTLEQRWPADAVSHDVERWFQQGRSWPDVLEATRAWLQTRSDVKALEAAAVVLAKWGARTDLDLFDSWAGSPCPQFDNITVDTSFRVYRHVGLNQDTCAVTAKFLQPRSGC